ncbi:Cold shock protein [Syntrophomonas zehnderi OL-4]|uniref:Ribonuclease R n=1 Tax=Syntrophomonas zehnderi OL-4 TaxID=690567 RepID=A0A0E3W3D4_9FIRM|nr:ribonuclease R [Syntrophomonas zehnderi]CFX74023.1 Cold shock protein [Syntrophomonas zehnderi OL-4]
MEYNITPEHILTFMRQASYRPLSYQDLLEALELPDEAKGKFSAIIGKLEKEGEIVRTRRDKYGLPEMMNIYRGIIRLSQRGYGILVPDQPGAQEIFVYGRNLNGAMHGDRVMVRIQERAAADQRPEGEVIRAIERANQELVGTIQKGRHILQVIPDDPRQIYPVNVKPRKNLPVKKGDKVLVKITGWPDKNKYPEGTIVEIFGRQGQPGVDMQIVIKKHALREEFPPPVIAEAQKVTIPVSSQEISRRRDLRDLRTVTIDGEDAKDLDDAISIEKTPGGYRLGVHIADVSHYVREDSKLDKEAFARGTSVYLIDKVLPMLPPELSNGICSLNARQDRLAITCLMEIDHKGKVQKHDIFKSVIRVKERMTYTAVNKIITDHDPETKSCYSNLVDDFLLMKELSDIIRRERTSRGALDFDFPESKVRVDETGFPIDILPVKRGAGEMLIEDFMIKANEVVAEYMYWQEMPTLYRVHEKPEGDALARLNQVLAVFGHKIQENKIEPYVFQKILRDIKGTPQENTISLLVLRSMKHARYVPQALGHFGLASKYYCHFTSPIRRYPDLIVHRVLSLMLDDKMNAKKKAALESRMNKYGEQSSLQETKAEEAERELLDIKKAQYMQQFLGDEFVARISSVQSFGFFVQLPNTVEGLVHISTIADDYYEFNDRNYTLVGIHTGKKYSIGAEVRVQLVSVDVDSAKIDFELA